jgi:hypothetical protein
MCLHFLPRTHRPLHRLNQPVRIGIVGQIWGHNQMGAVAAACQKDVLSRGSGHGIAYGSRKPVWNHDEHCA